MASHPGLVSVRGGLPEPAGGTARRVGKGPLRRLVIVASVAFVSSIPFEPALVLGGGFGSISRVLGYVFFALALLQPGMCFRKPPRALWWFALYLGLYVLTGLYQPAVYWPDIASTAFRLAQFLVLLWVEYNLLQYDRVAKWVLWGFGLSCVVVAFMLASGIGAAPTGRVIRQTVFGQGPNTIAAIIGLGAVALIGMAYGRVGVRQRTRLVAWAGFLIVAVAITRSGSRGALVGLGAGLMTLLTARGSARTRMRNAVVVVLAMVACVWITIASATAASRWEEALDEGGLGGRQQIFLSALRMFQERPVMGWGPVVASYELGQWRGTVRRDTHNMFLTLLTEQGLVGTILFCIGLAMCGRAAWRGRQGAQGLLPLALFVAVLTLNLSGTLYVTKWFWVVMAYALASETYVRRRRIPSRLPANWPEVSSTRSGNAASHRRRRPELYPDKRPFKIGRELGI